MKEKLHKLYKFMDANGTDLGYNHELQKEFKRLSMAFLKALQKELPFTESNASFNPGGIAVSGDARLMGMFKNGIGIYILINEPWSRERTMNFLYRTISHMKDYTGGSNNYMTNSHMQDAEVVLSNIKRLCNV